MSCVGNLTVRYAGGKPASFASVDVFQVNRVLWWEVDSWVTSKTCDVYGRASFTLVKGRKYHFIFKASGKRGDLWRVLDYCPFYVTASFPS